MIRRTLEHLLRLCPADFRDRCGDEFLQIHDWRTARRGPGARAVLAMQEIAGLSLVILRLRAASFGRATRTRLPAAWGHLQPDPVRWGGPALAGGAVLVVMGTGIGYGAGVYAGFALVPVAFAALAWGLAGRARISADLSLRTRKVLRATAVCGASLAALIVLYEIAPAPLASWVGPLRYPAFIGFMAGVTTVGVRGMLLRELPISAAATVTVGALMILTGFTPLEGISEMGVWVSSLGWIALGFAPWGSGMPARPVAES